MDKDTVRNNLDTVLVNKKGDTLKIKKDPIAAFRSQQNQSVKHGQWIVYFDGTDIPYQKVNYSKGRYDGVFTTYWSNGKIQSSITYQNGRKNGIAKFYSKEQKLAAKIKYIKDNEIWKKKF